MESFDLIGNTIQSLVISWNFSRFHAAPNRGISVIVTVDGFVCPGTFFSLVNDSATDFNLEKLLPSLQLTTNRMFIQIFFNLFGFFGRFKACFYAWLNW